MLAKVANLSHKQKVVSSSLSPATNLIIMKKLDVIKSEFLNVLIRTLNSLGVQKEDLVGIYPPVMGNNEYQAIFYYEEKEK